MRFYFRVFLCSCQNKAVDGFEPTIKLLQSHALPLGYTATTILLYTRIAIIVKISHQYFVITW